MHPAQQRAQLVRVGGPQGMEFQQGQRRHGQGGEGEGQVRPRTLPHPHEGVDEAQGELAEAIIGPVTSTQLVIRTFWAGRFGPAFPFKSLTHSP